MPRTYEMAPDWVAERVAKLVTRYHPDLERAGVTFDLLFAYAEEGPALKLHGRQALGIARVVPEKDRVAGRRDAEISIDAHAFEKMHAESQDALLDHELEHFVLVRRTRGGGIAYDDHHRPKLKTRPHDWDFGWFDVIARRYRERSHEVIQARQLWDNRGQCYFPWSTEAPEDEGFLTEKEARLDLFNGSLAAAIEASPIAGHIKRKLAKDGITLTVRGGKSKLTKG